MVRTKVSAGKKGNRVLMLMVGLGLIWGLAMGLTGCKSETPNPPTPPTAQPTVEAAKTEGAVEAKGEPKSGDPAANAAPSTADAAAAVPPGDDTVKPEPVAEPTAAPEVVAEPGSAAWILAKAQQAHGGLAELEKLGRLTFTATGKTADGTETVTLVRWAYPVTISLTETSVGSTRTWGHDADGCWVQRGLATVGCDPIVANTVGYAVQAMRHASLLPPAPSEPTLLSPRTVSGIECPTIQIGEIVLSFHPETYLLMGVSNPGHRGEQGTFETTFAEWTQVGGAKFPTQRVTRFAGADVITETWSDIKIAGPEGVAAQRPKQVDDGAVVHMTTEPQVVAVLTVKQADLSLPSVMSQLIEFAGKHGLQRDFAPAFTLTPVATKGDPEVDVAIPLLSSVDVRPKRGGETRIETVTPRNVLRVYHYGNTDGLEAKMTVLAEALRNNKVTKVPNTQVRAVGLYDPATPTDTKAISYLELEVNEAPPTK